MSASSFEEAFKEYVGTYVPARGRRVLGEKGVGRFAAARLASKLEATISRSNMDFQDHRRNMLTEVVSFR